MLTKAGIKEQQELNYTFSKDLWREDRKGGMMNERGIRTERWRLEPRGSASTIGPAAPKHICSAAAHTLARTHARTRASLCVGENTQQHTQLGNGSAVLLECKGRHT